MRRDILNYVVSVCERFHIPLSMHYYPPNGEQTNDLYSINLRGRAVLNFTSKNFYDLPKAVRNHHFLPLIRCGMAHNLGEKSLKDQVLIPRNMGIRLIKDGKLIYG